MTQTATGYAHQDYMLSLAEFGAPMYLPASQGWLLERDIPGSRCSDAIGAYPLFSCANWQGLGADLADLPADTVAVSLVADPCGHYTPAHLQACFDFVRPFKQHYVADLAVGFDQYMHRHHRRYARRALAVIDVQHTDNPAGFVAEWSQLYAHLCARLSITGLRAFSPTAFAVQLALPGAHYFRALNGGETVGGLICMLDRGNAYAHLVATTERGQALMAQYALYWRAIKFFRDKARVFDLGSVPDSAAGQRLAGLAAFKSGWATATRTAWLCGKVLDQARYEALCRRTPNSSSDYFPAYRAGKFG